MSKAAFMMNVANAQARADGRPEPYRMPTDKADRDMQIYGLLERIAALSDAEDDDTQWLTALATDVMDRGIAEDEDPASTADACAATRRIALELRSIAGEARRVIDDIQQEKIEDLENGAPERAF